MDISVRVAHCNNLCTKLSSFLNCIDCNITGTCNNNSFSVKRIVVVFHQFVQNIYNTVSGSFCTDQGTTIGKSFTCQNAFIKITNTFVLSEEISNLTSANTDVTSRYVCVCADVFAEFCHKALAECHNFSVRFALRIEVGTTFTATDRETCKGVLENLLEAEKFKNALVYCRMETKTTFVWSDRTVELYTVSFVYLYFAVVIYPRNTERNDSFWLYQTFQNGKTAVFFFIFVDNNFQRIQYFFDCLMEFWFARILCNDSFINFFCVRHVDFLLIRYMNYVHLSKTFAQGLLYTKVVKLKRVS